MDLQNIWGHSYLALLIGAGFAAYIAPQLTGMSRLSEFEQNMNQRAESLNDPFLEADGAKFSGETPQIPEYNENPTPDAADANSDPELDIVIVDEEAASQSNDLSISELCNDSARGRIIA